MKSASNSCCKSFFHVAVCAQQSCFQRRELDGMRPNPTHTKKNNWTESVLRSRHNNKTVEGQQISPQSIWMDAARKKSICALVDFDWRCFAGDIAVHKTILNSIYSSYPPALTLMAQRLGQLSIFHLLRDYDLVEYCIRHGSHAPTANSAPPSCL